MNFVAVDETSGAERVVDIEADDTVRSVKRRMGEAFGYDDDATVRVSGVYLGGDDDDMPMGDVEGIESGTIVSVSPSGAKYAKEILGGSIEVSDLPRWALLKRDVAMAVATKTGDLRIIPPIFRGDKDVVLAALCCKERDDDMLEFASPELRGDKQVVATALSVHPRCFRHAAVELRDDKSTVLLAVETCGQHYELASEALRRDKDVALAAIAGGAEVLHPCHDNDVDIARALPCLRFCSDAMRDNLDVVLAAVKTAPHQVRYASERVRNHTDVIVACLGLIPNLHFEATDKETALRVIRRSTSNMLQYCSEALCADKEVVLEAVVKCGDSLRHASAALRGDRQVVAAALATSPRCFVHASPELRNDKEITLLAVKAQQDNYVHASDEMQRDRDVALAAASAQSNINMPGDFVVHPSLRNDKAIGLALRSLVHLGDELRDNFDVVKCAMKHNGGFELASQRLRAEPAIALEVIVNSTDPPKAAWKVVANQREIMLRMVMWNGLHLQHASEALRDDKEFVLEAVRNDSNALEHASTALRSDYDCIAASNQLRTASAAARSDKDIIKRLLAAEDVSMDIDEDDLKPFLFDKDVIIAALAAGVLDFTVVPHQFHTDEDVMMRSGGYFARYSNSTLRETKRVVLAVVAECGDNLGAASAALRDDEEVVLAAIEQMSTAYDHASVRLKETRSVVLAAAANADTELFRRFPSRFADDRDVVLAAVAFDGLTLKYASTAMRDDPGVVLAAVESKGEALRAASERMRSNRDIVLAAVQTEGHMIFIASPDLQEDPEICSAAVSSDFNILEQLSPTMQNNRDIVIASITHTNIIDSIKKTRWMADKVVVLVCLEMDGSFFDFVSAELKKDKEVVQSALEHDPYMLKHMDPELRKDKDVILTCVSHGLELDDMEDMVGPEASAHWLNQKDVVVAAVAQDGSQLEYANDTFKNNLEVVLAAVTSSPDALRYIGSEILNNPESMARVTEAFHVFR